jgi:HEAT repeats
VSELDNWDQKYRNDSRSDEELMTLVLAISPDVDDEAYWHPIGVLQNRLPEILERVTSLLRSGNEKEREIAGTILGQSRRAVKWDVKHCVVLLAEAVQREPAVRPLAAMLHGLGHLHDESIIPIVTAFRWHEDANVRYALTNALHAFENLEAIQTLIELSADTDRDVRNWATFNLGSQIEMDIAAIRDALAARLNESDDEILWEAIVGLARRGDARLIVPLTSVFDRLNPEELRNLGLAYDAIADIVERAVTTGEIIWLPVLLRAQQFGIGDQATIKTAIEKCGSGVAIGQTK